ncbi:MAG: fructose-specific PTS transporter subunit EIIC [Spirochaetaceae bacterium]|jgi:PTS system fructose-specific IIC component|nr:fructose-specific PTS transporter subunit EIIC [Spirochaetaceae bacterium]
MRITDLLVKDGMIMDLRSATKEGVIEEMTMRLQKCGRIADGAVFKECLMNRESKMTTALGKGFALPHAKSDTVVGGAILFAKSHGGVDYAALDGQPVYLFFMIAMPSGADDDHVAAVSALSKYLIQEGFLDKLKAADAPEDVVALFAEDREKTDIVASEKEKYVVAVTACPAGIAHTYLAEEALKQQAAKMGVTIKVETVGAAGVGNKLTRGDIARAEGVIVAADKAVEMARFDGKPLVNCPVAEAVRNPGELIAGALNGSAPVYRVIRDGRFSVKERFLYLEKRFYDHLMSGVSIMLPFVICGGMTIALAYCIDNALGVSPEALGLGSLGRNHSIARYFLKIGNAAFSFMLPVLAGYIAYSIADGPAIAPGFVAGAITDVGISFGRLDVDNPISAGFLGALVGGFLAGGVVRWLKKVCAVLPKLMDGIKSIIIYPVFGVLITGFLMLFINIPLSGINVGVNNFLQSLSRSGAGLLGAFLGGMMAVDMGGRLNKTAYVFATGTLAASMTEGGSVPMSAVMAGGMVPPLAVVVATTLFRRKFTKRERGSGLMNIVMGLSFITEGAIPFCAADPVRGIPSFVAGSALAGALAGAAGIKLMAPHGGIFVIALTNNPLSYLLFIFIGALVSGVLFGLLKKPD